MDNQAAICQVESEASSQKSKHVDIKYKMIKDYYHKGIISPKYISTTEMIADLFTKAFDVPTFRHLCGLVGLRAINDTDSTWRGGVLEQTNLWKTPRTYMNEEQMYSNEIDVMEAWTFSVYSILELDDQMNRWLDVKKFRIFVVLH